VVSSSCQVGGAVRIILTSASSCIHVLHGQDSYTNLDFADDASLLAELLGLLVPVLEMMASEATSQGFEVNWPNFGHQGECAIDYRGSGPTGCSSCRSSRVLGKEVGAHNSTSP